MKINQNHLCRNMSRKSDILVSLLLEFPSFVMFGIINMCTKGGFIKWGPKRRQVTNSSCIAASGTVV